MMRLSGLRVLVVEDEPLVAMDIEQMLEELGCKVAAVAGNLPDALDRAQLAEIDAALIDIYLDQTPRFEVADILARRAVPILFTSGADGEEIPERFRTRHLLSKPFSTIELGRELSSAVKADGAAIKFNGEERSDV